MGVYVDTGILVKLYVMETTTPQAITLVLGFRTPLPLTHIQELENALRLKRGRGELTERAAEAALRDFQADIEAGRYERPAYDLESVFARAETLSRDHAAATKCRSLDVLHVAAAREIGCIEFASFDERQRAVARAAGFAVLPA